MTTNNLTYYDQLKEVPEWAIKPIIGGRLKGLSDIKPQWRIRRMTEIFGVVGIGWKYTIDSQRLETGSDGQIAGFVDVSVYIKHDGEWSAPIQGLGGSTFVEKEKAGPHMSDEVFKMALTDALGTAFKMLGVASDVYMGGEKTKYAREQSEKPAPTPEQVATDLLNTLLNALNGATSRDNLHAIENDPRFIAERVKLSAEAQQMVNDCYKNKLVQYDEVPA